MPQNNQEITNSPEFKEFIKNTNLEVFNLESINILLYKYASDILDSRIRIQQLEERLMEVGKTIKTECYDMDGKLLGVESLADKWNKGTH